MGSAEEDRRRPTDEGLIQALNNLSSQDRTDHFRNISAAEQKDFATTLTQDLPAADKKDVATAATQDLPIGDREGLAIGAVGTLAPEVAPEEQKDVGQMLMPQQAIVNRIWMMVVITFCAILPLSAAGVFYAAITESAATQTILIVFTYTASLLAALLAGRGLLASVLGRRRA
jgi:hypothetical protein